MPILYILCGPSGCGKSTWAKTDERMQHCAYVSRDEVRLSILKDEEEYFAHEKEVFAKFVNIIANYLIDGFDTIAQRAEESTEGAFRAFRMFFLQVIL